MHDVKKEKTLEDICKYAEEDKFNDNVYKCKLIMYKICLYKDYKKCNIHKYCRKPKYEKEKESQYIRI